MRVLFLGNNEIGFESLKILKKQKANIAGLVLHPTWDADPVFRKKIIKTAKVSKSATFLGNKINEKKTINAIKRLKPDVALMLNFGYIVKQPFIDLFPQGVINLHTSYLPHCRGQFPNAWSIIERVPAGVSLHYVNAGIDTGPILFQKKVAIRPTDTGKTLYQRLQIESLKLVKQSWPKIKKGNLKGKKQSAKGSFHRTSDVEAIDEIKLNKKYRAGELIDLLRARTFEPYDGAYFVSKGKKVYMRLELYEKKKRK